MLFCYSKKKGVPTNFLVTTPNIIDPKTSNSNQLEVFSLSFKSLNLLCRVFMLIPVLRETIL